MSTPLLDAGPLLDARPVQAAAPPRPRLRLPSSPWLREPLLHFVVVGGLLFAIDRVLISRDDDPHTIVVGGDVDHTAIETFRAARGRAPNDEELGALRRVWLDNEVLYRE